MRYSVIFNSHTITALEHILFAEESADRVLRSVMAQIWSERVLNESAINHRGENQVMVARAKMFSGEDHDVKFDLVLDPVANKELQDYTLQELHLSRELVNDESQLAGIFEEALIRQSPVALPDEKLPHVEVYALNAANFDWEY